MAIQGLGVTFTPKSILGAPAAFLIRSAIVVHADHCLRQNQLYTVMPFARLLS